MSGSTSNFSTIPSGMPDPIMQIMNQFIADSNPDKIDVSVGVYKSDDGEYYLPNSVAKGKKLLSENDPGHNYTSMAGISEFVAEAKKSVFGEERACQNRIAALQTISGTGSLHMGMVIAKQSGLGNFYIGIPTWGNYKPMLEYAECEIHSYEYYDYDTRGVNFDSIIKALENAPAKSTFLFQACCHNPTGADITKDQWKAIATVMKQRELFPFFDIAYMGLGSGDKDEDSWAIRYFFDQGFEMIVAQSFSKNMALYGERVGCLYVVSCDEKVSQNVQSKMISNFRVECSFAPAFGARVATATMKSFKNEWDEDVKQMAKRLVELRQAVFDNLKSLETPGNWDHVIRQTGLFWFSGLTVDQINKLREEEHIYMTLDGRVNIAGLNSRNLEKFCKSIDRVVRN